MTSDSKENFYESLDIENGIASLKFKNGMSVDLAEAVELVKLRLKLQKGKTYPILIDLNNIQFGTFKAREYMAKEGLVGISAGAFLVTNNVEKLVLNFFLKLNKPNLPTRTFYKERDALTWLEKYK
jgi:hypothetical protein